jgi:hypothetical protein
MTVPFRRRHNDAEASHDRARSLIATGFVEPTEPADADWLAGHLAGCSECRADLAAFAADREVLRTLRDDAPRPPRDLWARTAAEIERSAGRRDRPSRSVAGTRIGRVPLGVASGVLVVLVVVATSLFPKNSQVPLGPTAPLGSEVAHVTPQPEATPLAVTAKGLTWVEEQSDGTFQLVFADVEEVCTSNPEACAPIDDASTSRLTLASEPEAVVLSPNSDQLVVVSAVSPTGSGGEVLVVPVPTPEPSSGPGGTPVAASPTREIVPTPAPTATPTPAPTPTLEPGETAGPTLNPAPTRAPDGSLSILTGVVVVGAAEYSSDAQWLAFSARPIDGSMGPDLYMWRVGDESGAVAVTTDHRTFFAGWLGNLILASRVGPSADESTLETTIASSAPSSQPDPTAKPGRTPKPSKTPPAGPRSTLNPNGSPNASLPPAEDHPVSFLLDPQTLTILDLAGADIWRPIVNSESRTIVYWSGTLIPDATGTGWGLGTGRLVLDGWRDPASLAASPEPGSSAGPSAGPTSADPSASPEPTPPPGPAGSPVTLAEGQISDFDVRFAPSGARLAVWIADSENDQVGTLRLVALDPLTGALDPLVDPLPAASALRGFSIDKGRLAWVTPPGQDGESSHVNVLAWHGNEFGQVRSIAADERLFVVR